MLINIEINGICQMSPYNWVEHGTCILNYHRWVKCSLNCGLVMLKNLFETKIYSWYLMILFILMLLGSIAKFSSCKIVSILHND